MQILDRIVPYAERCIRTADGTAIVWPFMNAEKGPGPYELFLDTNALKQDVRWFKQLPAEIRTRCVINPWPALMEQWFSNPAFRASTAARIDEMISGLAEQGAVFRDGFAQQQEWLLRENEAALRAQFSLPMPYIAIMKSLLAARIPADHALNLLEELIAKDIPRFTSSVMLTTLAVLLKQRQSLKLADDSKPAFSYLDSFLAFQPGKKDETDHINVAYLRNRAGDLNLWLTVPLLRQLGYHFVGTPAIVTGDRALHGLIVRTIPPVLQSGAKIMGFYIPEAELPSPLRDVVMRQVVQVKVRAANPTHDEQRVRMTRLFEEAKKFTKDEREKQALDSVLSEWWLPGYDRKVRLQ